MDTTDAPQTGPEARPELLTVKQFCARNPWATQAMLRWQIFKARETGFDRCLYRFGRKVLLDEEAIFTWMKESAQCGDSA